MEETSEELPNFSIGIDFLGPDPTSSKNKAELKKLASCTFRKFVEDQLQQILAERHSLGTEQTPTGHQQHLKVKFPFLLLFLNLLWTFVISGQSDFGKISLAITTQITQEDINLLLTKTTAARSSQEAVMTSQCS